MKFVLNKKYIKKKKKKKNFLKPKQICILYTEKPQKEKKNEKKRHGQRNLTINYKFIWNINKIINYYCLVFLLNNISNELIVYCLVVS